MKINLYFQEIERKKKINKYLLIFLIFFVFANTFLYYSMNRRYVSHAPTHLKEARKEIVNAVMFHVYYTFFIRVTRIDFQNPILYPFKAPRDYFYHKAIDKLPKDEAERAIWFDMFEASSYNHSVRGAYGSLARRYGEEFSKEFVDKVYENIKILSLYKTNDRVTADISEDVLKTYIDLIHIYVFEFHLFPDGSLFRKENMELVSTNHEIFKRFENIYEWQNTMFQEYRISYTTQYKRVMNSNQGWYGPYRSHYDDLFIITSFILFYKVNNDVFDCQNDRKYRNSQLISFSKLAELIQPYSKSSMQRRTINRQTMYIYMPNEKIINNLDKKVKNVLNLKINCDYIEKDGKK